MSDKINVARIKKAGNTFEINIDPDKALAYKKGELSDVNEVLLADDIFADVKKAEVASDAELQAAFETTDTATIADIILKKGEIQLTSEHRAEEREQRKRKLIHLIHIQAVDPKTNLPHPPARIEAALEQAKVHIEDHKTVEEQFDGIVRKLRPIIPIKIEQKELTVIIPSTYSGKSYNVLHSNAKVLSESWLTDGSLQAKVELPAGLVQDFIDKLNSLTHGQVRVE